MRRLLVAVLCALPAAGCAVTTMGQRFDSARMAELVPGRTTFAEAVQMFGEPASWDARPEGGRVVRWFWADVSWGLSGERLEVAFDDHDVMTHVQHYGKQ